MTAVSLVAALALVSGCATTGQVEELTKRVEAAEAEAAAAKAAAEEALAEARSAKGLAEDAAQCCVDTNAKIDRLFYRSQMK
jgi:murein lipoprotein